MWAKVRTILVVTLVTFLIWVWADAETQKDDLLRPADTQTVDEAELALDTLPVRLALPATSSKAQWERIHLEATEFKKVRIVGPRSVIEQIRSGDKSLTVGALLLLDEQDLADGMSGVSKSVELVPSGLGLRFVGPAPVARASLGR